MKTIYKKNKKILDKIINNYSNDEEAIKKDIQNQNKLNSEIKKVIYYKDKIKNKPIDTSILLKKNEK